MATSAPPAKRPKYTKLTQIEHVLLRPGMYIGPTAPDSAEEWVITEDGAGFERKQLFVSRGLVGIVNELLVNVRDVVTRYPEEPAKLSLSVKDGWITVTNTGLSHYVDVSINEEHQLLNPELVFTELRSGTNFDDSEDRLTGGQNGLGAKLALIFSSEAVIEVGDPVNQRKFSQRVAKNLNEKSTPKITSYKKQKGFVSISIRPEMHRFGMASLEDPDLLAILKRRCFEIAACTPSTVTVEFQGEKVQCKDFKAFSGMFGKAAFVSAGERWRVAVFNEPGVHFSIVNGINTRLQGSHVKHVLDRIVAKALPKVQEKAKDAKAAHVRDMLSVVLACDVVNPRFTSQAKEELAMPVKEFGSEYVPDEKDLAKLLAGPGGLVARAVSAANATVEKKATDAQAKTSRKAHLNIPKLDDAHDAGTRNNKGTVLQVTEGDSAKVCAQMSMCQEWG